jgi:hypothetical protein
VVNTSFELLEKMTAKVAVLETEIAELKKSSSGVTKASATASNNADLFKKLGEKLLRQILALENKT